MRFSWNPVLLNTKCNGIAILRRWDTGWITRRMVSLCHSVEYEQSRNYRYQMSLIVFTADAPHRTAVNLAVLKLSESGALMTLKNKWWSVSDDKKCKVSTYTQQVHNPSLRIICFFLFESYNDIYTNVLNYKCLLIVIVYFFFFF